MSLPAFAELLERLLEGEVAQGGVAGFVEVWAQGSGNRIGLHGLGLLQG